MVTINFPIADALNILRANNKLSKNIRDIKAEQDSLLVTIIRGIDVMVRQESFERGVLKLVISSKNWAFKFAASMGKVDKMLDEAIRDFPFIRREGKTLSIDLNSALQSKVKGVSIKSFEISGGNVKIEF
jgi:hypothetical protein